MLLLAGLLAPGCLGLSARPPADPRLVQWAHEPGLCSGIPATNPESTARHACPPPVDVGTECAPGTPDLPLMGEHSGNPDLFHFSDDVRDFPYVLWDDARAITNPENALILAVAAGAAVGIREAWDDDVRAATASDPHRWGDGSRVLGQLGEAQYQVPVLVSSWALSVWNDDPHFHDFNEALISAYTLNGLATLAIKGATNTSRPDSDWNGGQWGFPSFHASSTFTMAAVLEDYYGWKAGLPAYTLASLISWSRIDERDHDLSDVVFGAVMGYVIGKSVADFHLGGDGHVRLAPWCHPTEGASGVMLETRF